MVVKCNSASKNALVMRECRTWQPLSGQRAVLARWDRQEPAALAAIRARYAEVDDPLPPPVVEHSERLRRRPDDRRPRSQINHAEE